MSAVARIKTKGVRAAIAANGGIDGAAATVDKSRSLTGSWNNINQPDQPTLPDALALDEVALAATGRAPILSAMAAELGHVAICLPAQGGESDRLVMTLAEATGEFGDVAHAVTEALRDGHRSAKENEHIVQQIDEAQAALARMRMLVVEPAVVAVGTSALRHSQDERGAG